MNGAATNQPAPGRRKKAFDISGFLARRKFLILILGGWMAVALLPVFLIVVKPQFQADGLLLVDASKEITLTGRERDTIPGNVGDFTHTLVSRVSGLDVLASALKTVPQKNWPSFLDPTMSLEKNAVLLMKSLTVKDAARSYLVSLSVQADQGRGLGDTLNAVMERFIAKLQAEQELQNSHRLTYLREERTRIEKQIADERQRLLDLAEHVANKAFLHENYSVHLTKLEQIQKMYWDAESDRATKQGLLQKTIADQEELGALSLQPYADERVADNFGINRIEQWTYEQLQSLRANIDGLTSNNQDRVYVEQRMGAMNEYLDKYKHSVNDTTIRVMTQKREHEMRADVIKASTAYQAARFTSEELGKRLADAKQEASDTSEAIFKASDISFSVTQLREQLSALNTRIDDCEMEAKAPMKVSIDQRAANPVRPIRSTTTKALMISIFIGFGLAFGICLGFEFLDDRVRSRRELEGALGGVSPEPIPKHGHGDNPAFARVVRDAPASPAAVALRSLVVRLERERKQRGGKVYLVTGAARGAGATSCALNLADAFALMVPHVLFIELPSPAPAACALAGGAESLSAALAAPTDWVGRQGTKIGLARLADRETAEGNPAAIRELLRQARTIFDIIIVNAAPLADDLSQFVVLESDAAVVLVREDRTLHADLVRTLGILRAAPISAMTAVLNFTKREVAVAPGARPLQLRLARITKLHRRADAEVRARWTALKIRWHSRRPPKNSA